MTTPVVLPFKTLTVAASTVPVSDTLMVKALPVSLRPAKVVRAPVASVAVTTPVV